MRAVSYVSLSARRGAPLGHKELLAPILLRSYQRHVSVHRVSFHPRLRPPISDCVVYQLRTIRNISPLSSLLCLRRFFLARNSFLSLSASFARNPLPRYPGAGECTTRNHLGPAFREKESQRRWRNPAAPCFHGDTIHLLASPMGDMTYIITHRAHRRWSEFAIWECAPVSAISITSSFIRVQFCTLWILRSKSDVECARTLFNYRTCHKSN